MYLLDVPSRESRIAIPLIYFYFLFNGCYEDFSHDFDDHSIVYSSMSVIVSIGGTLTQIDPTSAEKVRTG